MEEDAENKKERIRSQLDIVFKIIEQENSTFLTIGSLAVALIVILSLNKDLVNFTLLESKILLTVFLSLIIVILGTYSYSLNRGKKKSINIIEEILGEKISKKLKTTPLEKIIAYVPLILTIIFCVCISYIIYVLWRASA